MPKKKPSINLDSLKSATKNVSRPVDTLKSEKESEAKVPIQVYCTEEQKKQLKVASALTCRSMTSLLTEALDNVIKKHGS
ncbi:hypothetical protein [Rubritalea tangerina]|uniref:CopG family transcriptional regulator n=1 Tax=Rubritalea tangerina TaxID=430798 RepID=A0ABW4ZEL3_9BACT